MATKWKVRGALRDSGQDVERIVEAPSRGDAQTAVGEDVLVSSVEIYEPPPPPKPPVAHYHRPKQPDPVTNETPAPPEPYIGAIRVAAVFKVLMILLVIAGVGNFLVAEFGSTTQKADPLAYATSMLCFGCACVLWALGVIVMLLRDIAINTSK